MTRTVKYPTIEAVTPMRGKKLLVQFSSGEEKVYDCRPLLSEEPFGALANESFFCQVKVDAGGYGVSWSDEIDLSESELWLHGTPRN